MSCNGGIVFRNFNRIAFIRQLCKCLLGSGNGDFLRCGIDIFNLIAVCRSSAVQCTQLNTGYTAPQFNIHIHLRGAAVEIQKFHLGFRHLILVFINNHQIRRDGSGVPHIGYIYFCHHTADLIDQGRRAGNGDALRIGSHRSHFVIFCRFRISCVNCDREFFAVHILDFHRDRCCHCAQFFLFYHGARCLNRHINRVCIHRHNLGQIGRDGDIRCFQPADNRVVIRDSNCDRLVFLLNLVCFLSGCDVGFIGHLHGDIKALFHNRVIHTDHNVPDYNGNQDRKNFQREIVQKLFQNFLFHFFSPSTF